MRAEEYKISSDKFVFHTSDGNIHDTKLETKPVSYFRDALNRFAKNKASIVAAAIIALLILFALIAPIVSPYTVAYEDTYYKYCRPRNKLCYNLGLGFWDGGAEKEVNQVTYDYYRAIALETNREVIMEDIDKIEETYMGKTKTRYFIRLDTYNAVGAVFVLLSDEEYASVQKYQDENEVQIILPMTDPKKRPTATQDENNANYWYATKQVKGKTEIDFKKNEIGRAHV